MAGRPRLRVTAALSSRFDDARCHKAPKYPDEKVAGGWGWRGGGGMEAFQTEVRRSGSFRADLISPRQPSAHTLLRGFGWSRNGGVVSSVLHPLMADLPFLVPVKVDGIVGPSLPTTTTTGAVQR